MRKLFVLIFLGASLWDCVIAGAQQTNSAKLSREQQKAYMARVDKIFQEYGSNYNLPDGRDKLFEAAVALQKDYPSNNNGWQLMMMAIEDSETKDTQNAREWAKELANSSAPGRFKLWARGFLHRMDSQGKPVTMKFIAVDGREVDLSQMKGKVVLVDFWATTCGPCVAELPAVKEAYEKYHEKGFEVIGISCDTEKENLKRFLRQKEIVWPHILTASNRNATSLRKASALMAFLTCF